MKVFVNGELYDSDETGIVLVFDNDAQRKAVASHLTNMPEKDGKRMYAYYPLEKYTPDEIIAIFNELESKGKPVGFYSQIKYATRQR